MSTPTKPGEAEPSIANERRRVRRLWYFWAQLRRDRALPAFSEFDPHRLPVAWSACFVLTVAPPAGPGASAGAPARVRADQEGFAPVFDYVGPELTDADDADLVGRPASTVRRNTLLGAAVHSLDTLLARREPVVTEGEIADRDGDTILYRSILLPFGADGKTVDRVLGAVTFRTRRKP